LDDRRRDGGTNSTLRIKEQGTHLTLNEHDDDDQHSYHFYKILIWLWGIRKNTSRYLQ